MEDDADLVKENESSPQKNNKKKVYSLRRLIQEYTSEVFKAFSQTPGSLYGMDEDVIVFFAVVEEFVVSNFIPRIVELVEKTKTKMQKDQIQLATLMLIHEVLYVNFGRLWRSKLQNIAAPESDVRQFHYDRVTDFCQAIARRLNPAFQARLLEHLHQLNHLGPQVFFKASVESVQKASGTPVRGVKDMDFSVLDIRKAVCPQIPMSMDMELEQDASATSTMAPLRMVKEMQDAVKNIATEQQKNTIMNSNIRSISTPMMSYSTPTSRKRPAPGSFPSSPKREDTASPDLSVPNHGPSSGALPSSTLGDHMLLPLPTASPAPMGPVTPLSRVVSSPLVSTVSTLPSSGPLKSASQSPLAAPVTSPAVTSTPFAVPPLLVASAPPIALVPSTSIPSAVGTTQTATSTQPPNTASSQQAAVAAVAAAAAKAAGVDPTTRPTLWELEQFSNPLHSGQPLPQTFFTDPAYFRELGIPVQVPPPQSNMEMGGFRMFPQLSHFPISAAGRMFNILPGGFAQPAGQWIGPMPSAAYLPAAYAQPPPAVQIDPTIQIPTNALPAVNIELPPSSVPLPTQPSVEENTQGYNTA